jgi:hypothetical protein
MPEPPRRLTYALLADRIEAELGVRPALSTLRAAAADSNRGNPGTRLTAGMPAPLKTPDARGRTQFSAAAVDRWLARHPRRRIRREQDRLAATPAAQRARAVAHARAAGLSWAHIATALGEADARTYSRQWAQQRYRQAASS